MTERSTAIWWIGFCAALAGCDSSGGRGSESNFVTCTGTRDCDAGFVCNGAGHCVHSDGGSSATGGQPSRQPGKEAGTPGGSPHLDAAAESDAGGGDAGRDGEARIDGRTDGEADAPGPCFVVEAPNQCGAITEWKPTDPSGGWTVYRAVPLEGTDGFAAMLAHGTFPNADACVFATLDAGGGCAHIVSPVWTDLAKFAGVARAVSRGGTVALVGQCIGRFSCGRTLFLNGKEWNAPGPIPVHRDPSFEIDVADDGKVFIATVVQSYDFDSGVSEQRLLERWLSPDGQVLTERSHPNVQGALVDVTILQNDAVALAFTDGDPTPGDYVQFQSGNFEMLSTWSPGPNRIIDAFGARWPLLGVVGRDNQTNVWTGVVNAEQRAELWTRTRPELKGIPLAVEVDSSGGVSTAVWNWNAYETYLLLHDTQGVPASPSPSFSPQLTTPSPLRTQPLSGIRTQANGEILFSTDFAARFCEGP